MKEQLKVRHLAPECLKVGCRLRTENRVPKMHPQTHVIHIQKKIFQWETTAPRYNFQHRSKPLARIAAPSTATRYIKTENKSHLQTCLLPVQLHGALWHVWCVGMVRYVQGRHHSVLAVILPTTTFRVYLICSWTLIKVTTSIQGHCPKREDQPNSLWAARKKRGYTMGCDSPFIQRPAHVNRIRW